MEKNNASFRDPAGYIYTEDGVLFRRVNKSYQRQFQMLVESGLYQALVRRKLLVPHQVVGGSFSTEGFIDIQPERVPFISYPYEWSFSQLKDAALLTLEIQKEALKRGMYLKDASAFNVQFLHGDAIFIDTLSFEVYEEGQPWVAYRQFCQHFFAPLLLMAKVDVSLVQLLKTNIDGIPLNLASKLLPFSTYLSLSSVLHIHMHSRAQAASGSKKIESNKKVSKHSLLGLIDNLESAIKKLNWLDSNTEWIDYYEANNNYAENSLSDKESIILELIGRQRFDLVWDLGANTGRFSRAVASQADLVCAWDIDPACVELNYRQTKNQEPKNILPLMQDLTCPSPAIGWRGLERESLIDRGNADLVLALGLIHHLVISNNVPLSQAASFFAEAGSKLVIEFVPKGDSQVDKLLQNRADIFEDYTEEGLVRAFSDHFKIVRSEKIPNTVRTLFLMEKL